MRPSRRAVTALLVLATAAGMVVRLSSQTLSLPLGAFDDERAVAASVVSLAEQLLERPSELSPLNRYRAQVVAGRLSDAAVTLRTLAPAATNPALNVPDEIYVAARLRQTSDRLSFSDAFRRAFADVYGALDDRAAYAAAPWMVPGPRLRPDLANLIAAAKGKTSISVADAVTLVRFSQLAAMYDAFAPLVPALMAEDDQRRFVIDRDVLIRTPDGATISAIVVRPRHAPTRHAALLQFSIYAYEDRSLDMAKETAANGFVAVEAFTRGKRQSPDPVVPYEHDGDDARAVIEWIARQPWSDGRVGMYGGSYNGFTQWAVLKRRPAALKAIMTSATVAPGVDVPMEGNVFQTFVYKWPLYAASGPDMNDRANDDSERWRRLMSQWFESGRPFRDLPILDGTPNPFWNRWLDHPSYDAYWRAMIPTGREFAAIDIPVLQTTGYFDGGQVGVLHYFNEHMKHRPGADHTIVVGPYGHLGAQHQSDNVIENYTIDPAARLDVHRLRYEWFTHVLLGGPRPALLQDRINYEVMGGNAWKHAASIEKMSETRRRFYLTPESPSSSSGLRTTGVGPTFRSGVLAVAKPAIALFSTQEILFSDHTVEPPQPVISKTLSSAGGITFRSDRFPDGAEVSGLFSGELHVVIDKRDLDVRVQLYEETAQGEYFRLSGYVFRASYAKDRSRRELLTPGRLTVVPLKSQRFTSRQLAAGSRIVFVVAVNKSPGAQINYGSGGDVSNETLAKDGAPLHVQWSSNSFIDIPITGK